MNKHIQQSANLPRISVVTPTLNRVKVLENNIRNVMNQNYPNIEHIIIDGNSTDGTVSMLKKYKHLIWISESDRNHIEAVNKGVTMATGDIITCLNSDDYFEPSTLLTAGAYFAKAWRNNKHPVCLVGNCKVVNRKGKLIRISHPTYSFDKMLQFWKGEFPINPSSYLYVRKIHDELGLFDENSGIAYDYEFLLRMAEKYSFNYINQNFGNFLFDSGTITYDNWSVLSELNWKTGAKYRKTLPVLLKLKLALSYALSK
jgi:glycosyltransferase involved in cell wall biosynthesis